MKNILVITLGNSEIQIFNEPENGFAIDNNVLKRTGLPDVHLKPNRNYKFFFILENPRADGEIINTYYQQYKQILQYPLITPLLGLLQSQKKSFQEVWWVFTDQKDEHFRVNDTLFYKSILQKHFEEKYVGLQFYDYAITEHVKDIDIQYQDFYQKALKMVARKDEIDKIFLLPQGGIDQINHALTLQLIQLFKEKVIIYQNAEKSEPVQLQFTNLFLNDLTKQNVIKHIRDYDFDKAANALLSENWIWKLCIYAALRLNMKTENALTLYNSPSREDRRNLGDKLLTFLKGDWKKLSKSDKNQLRLLDTIIYTKILFKQGKYNEVLIKLFTVFENLFKIEIEKKYSVGKDILTEYRNPNYDNNQTNEKWELFLNGLDKGLLSYLKANSVWINNPNRIAFFYIYMYMKTNNGMYSPLQDEELIALNNVINELSKKRNGIAHNLSGISKNEMEKLFENCQLTIETFFGMLDKLMKISGLGIYQSIQQKILESYGETA
jgi:hypothetical protein